MSTLDLTLGALEIGVLMSTVLYGVLTAQAFVFSGRSTEDPLWLRIMVGIIWLFESIHTTLLWAYLYSVTVTHYGQRQWLGQSQWTLALISPFTSYVGATVQIFLIYRIRMLSGGLFIPVIAWCGSILRVALGTTSGIVLGKSKTTLDYLERYEWLITTVFILSAVLDVLTTVALSYHLWLRRSGFKSTKRMVDKLLMYTVETGLLTCLCAVVALICVRVMKDNFIDWTVFMIYGKSYSISLFTTLNARQALRRTGSVTGRFQSTGIFAQEHTDLEITPELPRTQSNQTDDITSRFSPPPFTFEERSGKSLQNEESFRA